MKNDPKVEMTPPLGDDERAFFDALFDDAYIARMYLASLVSHTPGLDQLAVKQRQLGLLDRYFSVGTHPKKEYYLRKLGEIAAILENERKILTEADDPREV